MNAFRRIRRSRLCGLLFLVAGSALLPTACNNTPAPAGKSSPAAKSQPSPEGKGNSREAEARAKLKIALDSWTFGDEFEKFEKDHSGIILHDERVQILPFGLDRPVKLIRYEIGAVRPAKNETDKYEFTYEFAVAMTVQNAKGDAARNATYKVGKLKGGKWGIVGEAQ